MAKKRRAPLGNYPNALTLGHLKSPPKDLAYIDIELEEGEGTKRMFFRSLPAGIFVRLSNPDLLQHEQISLMLEALSRAVVNPETGNPLATREQWEELGMEKIYRLIGSIGDVVIGTDDPDAEADTEIETESASPNAEGGVTMAATATDTVQ